MAPTLEIIKFRDVLRVTEIPRFVPNLPRTVELFGEDFSSAETVLINDIPAKEFMVVNGTTVWAQLPDEVTAIETVSVLSSNFTKSAVASKVEFRLGTKTKSVEGILKLVQLFCKILLQSPGSDIFDPSIGGGLQSVVGKVTSTYRTEPILAAITRSVSETTTQIRRLQLGVAGLPLSERLLSAVVVDMYMNARSDEAKCRIRVDSIAGQSAITALVL